MSVPRWAVEKGTRLGLDGFGAEFERAWSGLESRFLKVESWQAYREAESNESQRAYEEGDHARARALLREEAEADRPLYEDVRRRGIDFARIRIVQEPLTDYLRYELMSYQIRLEMGEKIEAARVSADVSLPDGHSFDERYFDFLLFDRRAALIHDYGHGTAGIQTGGWLVRDSDALEALEARALALRADTEDLHRYLAAAGL